MPSSSLRWLPGLLALGWLAAPPALAQTRWMVVRLGAQGAGVEGPVVVSLTGAGGAQAKVTLQDNGKSPDVTADDGMWSATVEVAGDTLQVRVQLDDVELDGGTVTFTDTTAPRDLDLVFSDGKITATAASAVGAVDQAPAGGPPGDDNAPVPQNAPDPEDGGPGPGDGGTPGLADPETNKPVGSPGWTGAAGPPASSSSGSSSSSGVGDAQLFIGLGVGILALVGVGWLWFVNRRRTEDELPAPQPEPGLLGPFTPSLSGGSSTWRTATDEVDALAWGLLGRLARHRRVVLAAPEGLDPGPVFGGPVYRASSMDVAEIADMADALEEQTGAPVAVLLVGDAAAEALPGLRAELSAGTGLLLVGSTATLVEPRALRCSRTDRGWRIEGPDGVTEVRTGAFGLEPPLPDPR